MNIAYDKINGRRGTSSIVNDYGFPDQPMPNEMTTKVLHVLGKLASTQKWMRQVQLADPLLLGYAGSCATVFSPLKTSQAIRALDAEA